jgi:pyruvate dehydrogenase E2 component (dihydrolipoamide acetyltransferase)
MIEFRLPSLGADMDEGKLLQWLVKPGDAVHNGQVIAVVDTAKAAIDVECWNEGVVHALLVEPDTTIAVGTPILILREAGETAEQLDAQLAVKPERAPHVETAAVQRTQATADTSGPAIAPRRHISPAARKLAEDLGVDIERVAGTGADGAVLLADVALAGKAAVETTAALPSKGDQMRQTIAAAMSRANREIPHYYLAEDILLDRASAWLAERNATRSLQDRLLMAAVLLKAVAIALERYPQFNGYWKEDSFVPGAGINVGVAVSLRQGGLVAPAISNTHLLDLTALTQSLLDVVKRARAGSLRSSEMTEATITVTNLGDQGVGAVFGVINPPQVALVGFGRIVQRPWVIADSVGSATVVTASLSADHRVTDGHVGGRFLAAVRDLLQEPGLLDRERQASRS